MRGLKSTFPDPWANEASPPGPPKSLTSVSLDPKLESHGHNQGHGNVLAKGISNDEDEGSASWDHTHREGNAEPPQVIRQHFATLTCEGTGALSH